MKYFIVLFAVLIVNTHGYSQEQEVFVNKKIDDFITNLSLKGVEKIVISDAYTDSMNNYDEDCLNPVFENIDITSITNHSDYLVYFVVWVSNKQVFIKKFDFCTDYEVLFFENESIVSTIKNVDFNTIYKETILPNQYIKGDTIYYRAVTCGTPGEIFFYTQNLKFSKHIDYNDLSEDGNMNYTHNKELNTIKLNKLLLDAIKQLDADGKFLAK